MPYTIERRYFPLVPPDMTDELFWKDGVDPEDERVWVPGRSGRWSRPLCYNVSQGYWVHITKVTESGVVSRYRHPRSVHTLVIDEGDQMTTLFHNSGALLYCDEDGNTVGSTDVFDRVKAAREHYEDVGLGGDFVKRFIR